MGAKTVVGRVAYGGGSRRDQPNNILVDERSSQIGRGRRRGNLYILLEVAGPASGRDLLTSQLTEAMRRAYYGWKGSVTAGLQQAIRVANDLLLEENRNSLPGERRLAGVSCVVLRDEDLFIAQAGPAAVYLFQQGAITRFPDESPWLDGLPPEEMDAASLGERREARIDLFHCPLGQGDTILLADTELARWILPDLWPDILSRTPIDAVHQELMARIGGLDLSALVLRFGDEDIGKAQVTPGVQAPPKKVPPVQAAVAPRRAPPLQEPVAARRTAPAPEPEPARLAQWHLRERLLVLLSTLAAVLARLWAGVLSFLRRLVPGQVDLRPSPAQQTTTVSRVEARRGKRPRARRKADTKGDPVQRLLVGVAIAIPVIVGVIVLVAWVQRGQAQKLELEALWQQTTNSWQQAQTSSDLKTTRALLAETQRLLDQYLERQPNNAEAIELQKKVQARLDVTNQVRRISWVGELNSYAADAELTRVVVQGAHVFVLDRRNGRVYHHRLDEQLQNALLPDSASTVLVSKGEQVGDVVVGDLVDMAWMPTGPNRQKASLIILESGGRLLDYDPATGQLLPLRVGANETWQFPKLVGSHSGRFYLLDSSANKILRYDPTPDGFSNAPDEWLQTEVDLAGAVDMAIGDSIYLLYADGGIRRFTLGQPDSLDISDWDTPPSNPTAIFTRPPEDTQWVYVADRGNSRIVQASKEGRFKQQFRLADTQATPDGDPLARASALFVDEIGGRAYLLSGQKLYLLVLPMSG